MGNVVAQQQLYMQTMNNAAVQRDSNNQIYQQMTELHHNRQIDGVNANIRANKIENMVESRRTQSFIQNGFNHLGGQISGRELDKIHSNNLFAGVNANIQAINHRADFRSFEHNNNLQSMEIRICFFVIVLGSILYLLISRVNQ